MVDPGAAAANFERLAAVGARGRLRVLRGARLHAQTASRRAGPVGDRARLHGAPPGDDRRRHRERAAPTAPCAARFHAEPIVQATELLLQERTPRDVAVARPRAEEVQTRRPRARPGAADGAPRSRRPHDPMPRTHLLSNGRYAVMITAAGAGYSRWRDLAVTRWREDVTCDACGQYVFLRDFATAARSGRRATSRAGSSRTRTRPSSPRTGPRSAARRRDHDDARRGGLARGRRGGPPRDAHEPGSPDPRHRADLLRRGRPRAAGGGRGPSRVLEAFRADGGRTRAARPAGDAPPAISRGAGGLGRARRGGRARTWRASSSTRPTGRASSVAGAASARPCR